MSDAATVRGPHKVALGLLLLVWLSCVWFGSWAFNPNNSTRLFAAISMVENGDATIDEFQALTIDKAEFDGHFYTDKTPGMTLMALPAVWLADLATADRADRHRLSLSDPGLQHYMTLRLRLAVATSTALLIAFAAMLLLDLATGITGSATAGLVTALIYALATPVWGWSTTLFGHAPVGALLLIASWAVWRGTSGPRELGRWRYALMLGAALGWAMVIELTAVLPGAVVGIWAIWRIRDLPWQPRARLMAMTGVAVIVALLPMLAYNQLAFGTPFRIGYQGVVGFAGMQQGLFGLTWPHPDVLVQILAGPWRGLVWVAPVLVLAPFGLMRLIRAPETRDLGWLATAIVAIVLLYNASYYYWDGGNATGPRHAIPAFGFLALGLALLWQQWGKAGRRAIGALTGLGMAINLAIAAVDVHAAPEFPFPLYDPVLTGLFAGDLRTLPDAVWGWPPFAGLALYLFLALPLLSWLLRAARLSDAAHQGNPTTVA